MPALEIESTTSSSTLVLVASTLPVDSFFSIVAFQALVRRVAAAEVRLQALSAQVRPWGSQTVQDLEERMKGFTCDKVN